MNFTAIWRSSPGVREMLRLFVQVKQICINCAKKCGVTFRNSVAWVLYIIVGRCEMCSCGVDSASSE